MVAKGAAAVAVAASLVLAGALPAEAKGREVRSSGACATGIWKLKAKADDGRLEVEYELDTNRNGQTWHVRITDNGTQVVSVDRTTQAPSGSFSIERRITNRAGADRIVAVATRGSRTCRGALTF